MSRSLKTIAAASALIVGLTTATALYAQQGPIGGTGATSGAMMGGYGMGPGMMGGYWPGYGWGFGMIGTLLWWVLIILGIVLLVKWIFGTLPGRGGREGGDRSLDILKARYARGDIGKDEYEQKKRDLGA